jgi:hypothetical protein
MFPFTTHIRQTMRSVIELAIQSFEVWSQMQNTLSMSVAQSATAASRNVYIRFHQSLLLLILTKYQHHDEPASCHPTIG